MSRTEPFVIDRDGDVNREIDEYRARFGMHNGDGLVSISGEEIGSEIICHEIPDDVRGAVIDEIHIHNSGTGGTVVLKKATLDSQGVVISTTLISVPIQVSSDTTRVVSYKGEPVEADAIVVDSDFTGTIGVGGWHDFREQDNNPVESNMPE
jgi:hypothetical protein